MSPAKPLPRFGSRGTLGHYGQSVRGIIEGGYVRILWREQGQRRKRSWPDTEPNREVARAFGTGVQERLRRLADGLDTAAASVQPITIRELWGKYATAAFESLRVRTQVNYTGRWRRFEGYFGAHREASDLTREHLDAYRKDMREAGYAPNQTRLDIENVVRVIAWGVDRDLVRPTKVTHYQYRGAKDERPMDIAEYTRAEADAILAVMEPRNSRRWRAWAATTLFAYAGPRARAALSLEWGDVDFDALAINWRGENEKSGRDRTQPMTTAVRDALYVAYGYAIRDGYAGPYVFFRPSQRRREGGYYTARLKRQADATPDRPWGQASYTAMLHTVEREAGVRHVKYRAAHGLKKLVVGDVLDATGDLILAGEYVGNTDLKVLRKHYVKDRPERLRRAAEALTGGAKIPRNDTGGEESE